MLNAIPFLGWFLSAFFRWRTVSFLPLFLLALPLLGQPVVVIPGGPGDAGFSMPSGFTATAYAIPQFIPLPTLPPGTQSTMRYGQDFTYTLSVPTAGMYVVMLGFVEPTVQGIGQRVFSVWANGGAQNQQIVQNLDLVAEAGYLMPAVRTTLLYISGTLKLHFVASVRNAVISLISVSPQGGGSTTSISSTTMQGLPKSCSPGDVRWVTDATVSGGAYFLYFCTAPGIWNQFGYQAGGSGALIASCAGITTVDGQVVIPPGQCTIDIQTDVIPTKQGANIWPGSNTFTGAFSAPGVPSVTQTNEKK